MKPKTLEDLVRIKAVARAGEIQRACDKLHLKLIPWLAKRPLRQYATTDYALARVAREFGLDVDSKGIGMGFTNQVFIGIPNEVRNLPKAPEEKTDQVLL